MVEKMEFVDTIAEATQQHRRDAAPRLARPAPKPEKSRLSHWPPQRWLEWRLENFTPWKIRPWGWGSKG